MLRPVGPVAVFGASNFPLAFSVAGDTAAALAAGNPVVVKAHPAHPGTPTGSQRCCCGGKVLLFSGGHFFDVAWPFSGSRHRAGAHPATKAVAFTGSTRAGRALSDAAAQRNEPIPVFAEMGSTNPLFVLPGAIDGKADAMAEGLAKSVLLGVGQFCTCPGLVFGVESADFKRFTAKLIDLLERSAPARC